ncbi:hypothetical protein LMH87_010412 [Akanthomyces muscarius]|uniref:Deoxyribose-phosphate aldolase 2 n=1 Tax=Akanthomyces muscarius TaxID=2231603 RepID=A0A9W8QDZ5_AKAMU|nr:hypothetical protein LMH87_010412 [Akanthomyces muscarius]KAJ4153947.1 hypothetical protein LMH87_010412 [Akanthomyces muscarius]
MPTKVRKFAHAFTASDGQLPALEAKKPKVGSHSGTLPLASGKSSKRFAPVRGGRQWTISIAVPGSMISNLATAEQRLATVARLARSLAIFCVDEVIVYDDDAPAAARGKSTLTRFPGADGAPGVDSYTGDTDPCHFVAQVLSFLECPPFMRRRLFPLHPNLRHTALLPTLDMPHHPHAKAPWLPYVEGVTVPAADSSNEEADGKSTSHGEGSWVDAGLGGLVHVEEAIPPNTRVTLRMDSPDAQQNPACAHPDAPRTEGGFYWGYAVRRSANLSGVFTECPYEGGYDLSVGTSERGTPLSQAMASHREAQQQKHGHSRHGHDRGRYGNGGYGHDGGAAYNSSPRTPAAAPSFRHLLVVFGGPRGIELAAAHDPHLAELRIRGAKTQELFDHWVNVLPGQQGSWAVDTDEAVPIALMGLRGLWEESV